MNELKILKQPLNVLEMKRMMEQKGYIEAIVPVELNDLLQGDLESFLDLISELATGSVCLMDVDYEIIQVINPYTVAIKVTGDASSVLDWEADEYLPNLKASLIKEFDSLFDFQEGYTPGEVADFTFKVIELVMNWGTGRTEQTPAHSTNIPYTYSNESEGEPDSIHQFVDSILALIQH